MLKIFKRGKYWYIRGTINGVRIYQSTKTTRKAEAEAACLRRQGELNRSPHSFARAVNLYLEAGGEERFATELLHYFGDTPLEEITVAAAHEAAHALYPDCKNSTKNRQAITPLRAILRTGADAGLCPLINLKSLKEERVTRPTASGKWFEKFFKHANPNLTAICLFMAKTGRRVSEAVNLTWDDVDLQKGVAYLPTTKTGRPVSVHLTPDLVAVMANLPKRERVFGYSYRWSVLTAIKRTCERASIKYLTTHELGRHTFATLYLRHGGNLRELMEAADMTPNTASRYAHIEPSEAKKKADNLPEYTMRKQK